MHSDDKELEILQTIHRREGVRQRDLARIVGLSLGMTNAVVRRLGQKGFLLVRKINNRNIRYAVTPAGAEEIARRSYRYFKRTIKNIVYYKEAVDRLVRDAKRGGYTAVALVGESDLDFIVEHCCSTHGLDFVRLREAQACGPGRFCLYSENTSPARAARAGELNLRELIAAV